MSVARDRVLSEAADRLTFGVGVWVGGAPHVTAQIDWDRRPGDAATARAAAELLALHRRIACDPAEPAHSAVQALARALDPKAVRGGDRAQAVHGYRALLVDLARAETPPSQTALSAA